ncbi:deaminase [Humidesulfovibrio sp.]
MRNGFSIIGLTGSLGSGSTEIASFISSGIGNYSVELKVEQRAVKRNIRAHFEFIKRKSNEFVAEKTAHSARLQDQNVKLDQLFEIISSEVTAKQFEEKLKIVNRRLRDLLIRRKIIKYFLSNKWDTFHYISMSTLIVKLMLTHAIASNGNRTPEYKKYCSDKSIPTRLDRLVFEKAKALHATILKFDAACEKKNWAEEDYKDFDDLFHLLESVKKEIYESIKPDKEFFQNMGDNIRATRNPFVACGKVKYDDLNTIAIEANKIIKFQRNRKDGRKNYFVIDSFRNPAEVRYFRRRYGSFYLCSLFAPKEYRRNKMGDRFDERADNRDAGKYKLTHELHKQDVPSCTLLADYAINTDKGIKHYQFEIVRLLTLIDFPGLVPPRTDEVFMNFAYAISLRSTCLSRQVGAVITNTEGFVIASGWNDVGSGQLGCSLVCIDDYKKFADDEHSISNWAPLIDHYNSAKLFKDYSDDDYFCFKDLESKSYLLKKFDKTLQKSMFSDKFKKGDELKALKDELSVKRLEYARSLHAEENAILQAARFGGNGIANGTIYTTTFPCELCSKKIYQAQLGRIVYTEPYPDSLSETVFLKDGVRQISIEQFEGVKSASFHRLFKAAIDLKEYQTIDNYGDEID